MTIQELGSIGEFVAAIATIATLAYLAIQIRAGARASVVEAKLQSTRLLGEVVDPFIQSPELIALFRDGRKSLDSLSPEDHFRFAQMCLKGFWFFSAHYFQFRQGSLSGDDWFEVRAVLRWWLRGQGCREWWASGRTMFGDGFVAFVESEMAESDAAGPSA